MRVDMPPLSFDSNSSPGLLLLAPMPKPCCWCAKFGCSPASFIRASSQPLASARAFTTGQHHPRASREPSPKSPGFGRAYSAQLKLRRRARRGCASQRKPHASITFEHTLSHLTPSRAHVNFLVTSKVQLRVSKSRGSWDHGNGSTERRTTVSSSTNVIGSPRNKCSPYPLSRIAGIGASGLLRRR